MRSLTFSSAYRGGAPAADHEQPGLFIEHLAPDDPPTVDDKRDDDARARRVRHRPPTACCEPTAGAPLQVPIDQLDDDPLHPREGYPQECLDDLAKDIAERGVLQAIVVAPADAHGRYRIRFGVQRWRAAQLAGLATVPIAVRAQPCEGYDQVAENLKRHGLSPLELARFIRSRVVAGESNLQIARKLAVDPNTVRLEEFLPSCACFVTGASHGTNEGGFGCGSQAERLSQRELAGEGVSGRTGA